MTKTKRRKFTKEFKEAAIKLVLEENYTVTEAASNLGIGESTLRKWVGLSKKKTGSSAQVDLAAENRELKKQNKRLRMEREILKKATAFFAKESE